MKSPWTLRPGAFFFCAPSTEVRVPQPISSSDEFADCRGVFPIFADARVLIQKAVAPGMVVIRLHVQSTMGPHRSNLGKERVGDESLLEVA
jgi:hypothetical protein